MNKGAIAVTAANVSPFDWGSLGANWLRFRLRSCNIGMALLSCVSGELGL